MVFEMGLSKLVVSTKRQFSCSGLQSPPIRFLVLQIRTGFSYGLCFWSNALAGIILLGALFDIAKPNQGHSSNAYRDSIDIEIVCSMWRIRHNTFGAWS